MPQKVIRFTGINRSINEFQNTGACEEMINVRPTATGHRIVKRKSALIKDVEYDQFMEHSWGNNINQIVVIDGAVYWRDEKNDRTHTVTDEFERESVSISTAGNVLLVYCEARKKQSAFKFEDGAYRPYIVSVPKITNAALSYDYDWRQPSKGTAQGLDSSISAMQDAFNSAASAFYNSHPNGLCGAAVIGCAYELEDGTELWSTAFVVADVTKVASYDVPEVSQGTTAIVYGARTLTLHLDFADVDKATVKKVNIYASRPLFPYELKDDGGTTSTHSIVRKSLDSLKLDNQIMFLQGSVEASEDGIDYILDFSMDQVAESLMNVLPACTERVGDAVSYNNRFHYYRSEVQHLMQSATVSYTESTDISYWIAYVKIDGKWKLLDGYHVFGANGTNDFIYPMTGVTRAAFVKAEMNDGILAVPYEEVVYVDMKDSDAYNYSYVFDASTVPVRLADALHDEWQASGQYYGNPVDEKIVLRKEENAMNVSAPFNPFVFPVEYSYSFGGEIKDIATSYLPISSTQIGQYPLTVFTGNGIYALEQGNGTVLYGNIVPLQPLVIEGKATATPHGMFFISSGNIYILAGREAISISAALAGRIDSDLKKNVTYQRLCMDSYSALPDFTDFISSEDFEQFVTGAYMAYDQLNNEVIISKDDAWYSYVFNIDTKAFHKIAKRYLASASGSRYLIDRYRKNGSTYTDVIDLHKETYATEQFLLQSRPFALDAFFTHIQRMILLADAKLQGTEVLCFSVFGSDNLSDWKCIISSGKANTVLRQIRTNKAAKSYRDYVILISGLVSSDTDLSDIIADYTVVSRRLG